MGKSKKPTTKKATVKKAVAKLREQVVPAIAAAGETIREDAPPRTIKLKIGCMFPDGPSGKTNSSVHEVELPRVHGLMLAAALKLGGTAENAFYLDNDEAEFTDAELQFLIDAQVRCEDMGENYPLSLPDSNVTNKVWKTKG